MSQNNKPLTAAQSDFAAKHEELIREYLHFRHLSVSEYYDIAVFGYLRAVRRYLTKPMLQGYSFKTIAMWAMKCELGNHFRALRAQKRDAVLVEFDDDLYAADDSDPISAEVIRREDAEAIAHSLDRCGVTAMQGKIIQLKSSGYSCRATARVCGLRHAELDETLSDMRDNIVRLAPELVSWAA